MQLPESNYFDQQVRQIIERQAKAWEAGDAEDAIIFELHEGKIKYWREYIDSQSQ